MTGSDVYFLRTESLRNLSPEEQRWAIEGVTAQDLIDQGDDAILIHVPATRALVAPAQSHGVTKLYGGKIKIDHITLNPVAYTVKFLDKLKQINPSVIVIGSAQATMVYKECVGLVPIEPFAKAPNGTLVMNPAYFVRYSDNKPQEVDDFDFEV